MKSETEREMKVIQITKSFARLSRTIVSVWGNTVTARDKYSRDKCTVITREKLCYDATGSIAPETP